MAHVEFVRDKIRGERVEQRLQAHRLLLRFARRDARPPFVTVPPPAPVSDPAVRRNLMEYRDQVLAGRWQREAQFCFFNRPIHDLAGSTLGIIGFGALGRAMAALGATFG